MVFGLKDFILGSVCFFFICILSCLMGQKKIVLKYLVFYVVIAAIQQLCIYLPQAIETILSIFTLFIRVMIPVVLFASTFIATTKVSELIAAMYSLKIPRSITITFAMVLRFFPTFSEEIHNIYDAMKLRGIALSWKNVFTRPMLILEAIAIPIVMRSASIAEELSASAVTRGIDNPAQRTSFIQLKVHAKDWMVQRALWAGVRRLISSNFLHLLLHHIVDDADFRNFQRRADLHGVDVPIVDQLVGQLAADTQHLPKLFDGHDVQVFRKHHLIKLSELSFLHRLEPPLSVLNPHFCGGFCLLPLIRIVPAPESHHGVSLL